MKDATNNKIIVPWIIAIALFMEMLDVTIITTAIPKMGETFMVNPIQLKLALTSYLLSIALFIPVSGWVADKWGTQRVFIFALLLFTLSSLGCGLSSNLTELVISRILQGIGGAFMMPVGRLIILRTFPKSELLHRMNFVNTPALLGPLLGPVVGGFITTYYSWPWIFYLNIPMGCLGILGTLRYIENYKNNSMRRFDSKGFLLFGLSLAGFYFAFETTGEHAIPIYTSILVGVCAILGFILFYFHYKKTHAPILDLKLFSIRTFFIAAAGNVWIRLGIGSVPLLLPLLLQMGYGLSPFQSGAMICVFTIGMIFARFPNKFILRMLGFRKMLSTTAIFTGITISSFSLINEINTPLILILIFINGVATSLQNSGMNILYYVDVEQSHMSDATSIAGTLQQLSMGFGITASTLILQLFVGGNKQLTFGNPLPFRLTFLVMGIISTLSVLVFLRLKPKDGLGMS